MSTKETQSVDSGNWFFFVVGAIAGGLIYDGAGWVINNYPSGTINYHQQ